VLSSAVRAVPPKAKSKPCGLEESTSVRIWELLGSFAEKFFQYKGEKSLDLDAHDSYIVTTLIHD
jgi:hypothetical protein